MAITVFDVPAGTTLADSRKIMVHDLTQPEATSTKNFDLVKVANHDLIDIRNFGAVPDGITDCAPALLLAKASAPVGALIYLKNRDAGIYRFDNTDPTLFNDCLFYVESNVIVSIMAGSAVTIKSVTPFTIQWEVLGNQQHKIYPDNPIKDTIDVELLKDNVIVREAFDAALFTVEKGFANWATHTGFGSIPANLTINNSKQLTLSNVNGAGSGLRAATADAIPGATISACARNSVGFGVLWIENAFGVAISTNGGDYNIHKFGDPGGAVSYSLPPGYVQALADNGVYENYATSKAVCGIKIHEDGKSVEFLHNGVNMSGHIITLGGLPITKIGFGAYNTSTVSWYDFILETNKKKEAYEDIQIQVFGDSQSVEYVGTTWVDYLQKFVNNSFGNRITNVENYAVSGQTLQQQETIFNSVTHRGISIILAGTNNIQAQTGVAGVLTSLTNMLTALNFTNQVGGSTVGVQDPGKNRMLLVIPPMYFSQSLNFGQGQASSNYDLGGAYRMAMLRWAAENDVTVVDLMTAMGATTALSGIMRDDIHFSDLGAAIAAKEIAKQLLILKSKVSANVVLAGNDKQTLHFVKASSAPVTPGTVAKWISVYQGGVEYKMPLYL